MKDTKYIKKIKPFVRYRLDEEKDSRDRFTVSLNSEERNLLDESKKIIHQSKDGTTIKQLAWIGAEVIHDKKMSKILGYIFKNKTNNKRLGIVDFD